MINTSSLYTYAYCTLTHLILFSYRKRLVLQHKHKTNTTRSKSTGRCKIHIFIKRQLSQINRANRKAFTSLKGMQASLTYIFQTNIQSYAMLSGVFTSNEKLSRIHSRVRELRDKKRSPKEMGFCGKNYVKAFNVSHVSYTTPTHHH